MRLSSITHHKYFPTFLNQGELFTLKNNLELSEPTGFVYRILISRFRSLNVKIMGPIAIIASSLTYFVNGFIACMILLMVTPFFFASKRVTPIDHLIYTFCHCIVRINTITHTSLIMIFWPFFIVPLSDLSATDIALTLMLIPLVPSTFIIVCFAIDGWYYYKRFSSYWPIPALSLIYGIVIYLVVSPYTQATTYIGFCSMAIRLKLDSWLDYKPIDTNSKFLSWYLAGPLIAGCIAYMGRPFGITALVISVVWESIYYISLTLTLSSL